MPRTTKARSPKITGSHHHDCEAIRGFYKVQEGLDLGTGIARGCLLDLVEHLASYFRTLVKQSHGQQFQNGGHREKQDATDGPGFRGAAPDRASGAAAPVESNRGSIPAPSAAKIKLSRGCEPKADFSAARPHTGGKA